MFKYNIQLSIALKNISHRNLEFLHIIMLQYIRMILGAMNPQSPFTVQVLCH